MACVPFGYELAGYGEGAGNQMLPQMLDDVPEKRGMCKYGFSYSAILRNCMPSLGVGIIEQ